MRTMLTDEAEAGLSQATVPILCYHAVATDVAGPDGKFAVTPARLREHLDLLVERGYRGISVRELVLARMGLASVPDRPVVITFDDGFADVLHAATPLLLERSFRATAFVTTVGVADHAGTEPNRRLTWSEIAELDRCGIEIAAHGHEHIEMDCSSWSAVEREVLLPKALLEHHLGRAVDTFAYPYGYSTADVRERVAAAGYLSACGVKHALSSAHDDRFDLARVRVLGATSAPKLERWLDGDGVRVSPCGERVITRLWRVRRQLRYAASARLRTR